MTARYPRGFTAPLRETGLEGNELRRCFEAVDLFCDRTDSIEDVRV